MNTNQKTGTMTVVNNPAVKHPEMHEVVAKILDAINDVRVDGYDVRVSFLDTNKMTVDINPISMSVEMKELLKFLDRAAAQTNSGQLMTESYFTGYFCVMFATKVRKAYPDDIFKTEPFTPEDVREIIEKKELPFKITTTIRKTDPSQAIFYSVVKPINLDDVQDV